MIQAEIYLGGFCNLDCIFCKEKYTNYISADLLYKTIDEIESVSNECITITGGEPTVRDEFFEIFDYCLKKFEKVILLTNLKKFKEEAFFNEFIERDLNKVEIVTSFDSHVEDTYNLLCGSINYLDKVSLITKIKTVVKDVVIGIVISKYNENELVNWYEFVKSRWADSQIFFKAYNPFKAEQTLIDELLPNYDTVNKELNKIYDNGGTFEIAYMPFCKLGKLVKYTMEYYNLKSTSKEKDGVMNLRKLYSDNVFHEKCPDCVHYTYCLGIHKAYFISNGCYYTDPITDDNLKMDL